MAGKSNVKASADLVFSKSPLFWFMDSHLLIVSSHDVRDEGTLWSLFYKGTNLIHEINLIT